MFKIGNGKELPAIPDHLSEEGKDFVRLCLQRNPHHRRTAAELLEHPFVKNAAPLERPLPSPEPADTTGVTDGMRTSVLSMSSFSLFLSFQFSALLIQIFSNNQNPSTQLCGASCIALQLFNL